MKVAYIALLALPVLTGCVSIELPGVVSDTAKVAKDTYKSVTSKKAPPETPKPAVAPANSVANTYVGLESQTPAEIKQLCVDEAAAKLFKAHGKTVAYTVTENTLSAINNAIAANCRITVNKPGPTTTAE
ncbi:hypothetical protein [Roseateles sp. LKC17W]|uniref:Lipoprotein n=1 Tax=Pelomonas margarita TaxID=3299031 RepID=A0ABW7FLV9_9BURK